MNLMYEALSLTVKFLALMCIVKLIIDFINVIFYKGFIFSAKKKRKPFFNGVEAHIEEKREGE